MTILGPKDGDDNYPDADLDPATGAIDTTDLADGVFSADAAGRAKMASGFFSEAAVDDKFASGAIDGDRLKAGALSADATGRALMATNFYDAATAADKFNADSLDASFCSSKIATGAIPPAKTGVTTASGITTGMSRRLTIDSATVKAALDTSANTLAVQLPVGTYIYDFVIWTQTAAGSAGTVKVGTDSNWNDASNDDAFVAAHNLNTPGTYKMSVVDSGSATSAVAGIFASGTADLTIQSSADLSASSWVGGISVFYF